MFDAVECESIKMADNICIYRRRTVLGEEHIVDWRPSCIRITRSSRLGNISDQTSLQKTRIDVRIITVSIAETLAVAGRPD